MRHFSAEYSDFEERSLVNTEATDNRVVLPRMGETLSGGAHPSEREIRYRPYGERPRT